MRPSLGYRAYLMHRHRSLLPLFRPAHYDGMPAVHHEWGVSSHHRSAVREHLRSAHHSAKRWDFEHAAALAREAAKRCESLAERYAAMEERALAVERERRKQTHIQDH